MNDRGLDYYAISYITFSPIFFFQHFLYCTKAIYLSIYLMNVRENPAFNATGSLTAASSERFYQSMDSTT